LNKENFIEISGGTDPVKLGQPAKKAKVAKSEYIVIYGYEEIKVSPYFYESTEKEVIFFDVTKKQNME